MDTPDFSAFCDRSEVECPEREILTHVMSRWGSLALILLLSRSYRFNELRRRIGGVSDKMLSQTLRTLEGDGFIHRHDFQEVPPRVEYSLTPLGRGAAEHVTLMGKWVAANTQNVLAARKRHRRPN